MDVEMIAQVAQDQTDSMKNLDGFAIPDCTYWSMDCGWVWYKQHSCSPDTFETSKQDTPRIRG